MSRPRPEHVRPLPKLMPGRVAVGMAVLVALAGCDGQTPVDDLGDLHRVCVAQMVSATCLAASDASALAGRGRTVFLAGVGAIDAQAYDALRQQGDAMCAVALAACRADAASPACSVARQLWGGRAPAG